MADKKDFFISYTHKDEKWAKWIAGTLEAAGHSTIIQAWDFAPSSNFVANMHKALINCDRFIAVLSSAYFESLYCQAEWTAAFTKDPSCEQGLFIPVRIEDIKPKGLFAPIVYIDLFGVDAQEAEKRILDGVSGDKPRNRPSFPGTIRSRFPGQLPLNNLPYARNPHFTGRDNIINAIRESFESGQYASLTQSIAGLGGVGKTQTVLEYAFRYGYLYDTVWWVNAESPQEILKAYTDFIHKKEILGKAVTVSDLIVEAVQNWMSQHENWLFIYDNAEDDESLYNYLPKSNTGNILITSRYTKWDKLCKPINLDVFGSGEAIDFLIKRTGIDDESGARKLVEMLGYLPLALEQAAAYIIHNHISYDRYLELYEEYKIRLFDEDGYRSNDYKSTVAITWNVSINKIESESARQLLNLCAFFAPDNIDIKLFSENSECLPEPLGSNVKNELKYNRIISELLQYSLIKVQNGKISINRLLQEVVQEAIVDKEKWIVSCLYIMHKVFNNDYLKVDTWDRFSILIPHALAIAEQAEMSNIEEDEVCRIYNEAGFWFCRIAMFSESKSWLMKALVINERALGKNHPGTSATYNNIGLLFSNQGYYLEALEWYKKALSIKKILYGENHPSSAITYNNIADVYYIQGDYIKAMEWYQKALKIREKKLGKMHLETARTYNNIASIYTSQQDYSKALALYQLVLEINEMGLGKGHPDTATAYNNVSVIYYNQGDYEKALEWQKRALEIREIILGKMHPDTAESYNNIAEIYIKRGNSEKAIEWHQKALVIKEKVLGDEHPNTAKAYNNIATFFFTPKKLCKGFRLVFESGTYIRN